MEDDEMLEDVPPVDASEELNNATRADMDLSKKGKSLSELLLLMDDYSPIIPDAVTEHYLAKAGFECEDLRVKRILGLATQKFISDIATDALQYSKLRQQGSTVKDRAPKNPHKDKRAVMSMDDLASALADHGVNSKRQEYFL